MTPIVTKDDPNGCFQRALPDEPLFTLLARDPVAPDLLRLWAQRREALNSPEAEWIVSRGAKGEDSTGAWVTKPHPDAEVIAQARYVAARMECWRYEANQSNPPRWREQPATDDPAHNVY